MLSHLSVQGLAVVDNVALDVAAGVTALTGETGAGKSLIVDALQLAVGARGSADMVRVGARAAHVTATFGPAADVLDWLRDHALDDEDESCVLRRVIGADGRSRAFINGRAVPVSQLREIGERLIDVHGQHAHQSLLKAPAQRSLLDSFLPDRAAADAVAAAHADLSRLDAEIAALGDGDGDPLDRLDFLRFPLDELRDAPITPAELDDLEREHRTLAHATEIIAALAVASEALDADEDGAIRRVNDAIRVLETGARMDERLLELQQSLRDCAVLLDEVRAGLHHHADDLQADDRRLEELDRLLALIHDLARKHRVQDRELDDRRRTLEEECQRIETATARLEAAGREREAARARFMQCAHELHHRRIEAAGALAAATNEVLATLGMEGAAIRFEVEFDGEAPAARHGLDRVTLLARTNPGQAPLPLARVASGGELSRIALSLHAVALDAGGAATVVFDEVDAGVGGAVAEILGRRIRELGERRQVLTVTHLPQVAACAHHHALVRKHQDSAGTHSQVTVLQHDEREQELARMLGGVRVTSATLAHAREMLAAGQAAKPRRRRSGRPAA